MTADAAMPDAASWLGPDWRALDVGGGITQHISASERGGPLPPSMTFRALSACAATFLAELETITDADIAAAQSLVAELSSDNRQIAVVSGGTTSLANQAIAQWAGWNIPGVGEGEQRFRPRTRLYDTLDPDTVRQVAETLNLERTSLLFLPCQSRPEPTQVWASALLPLFTQRLGADLESRVAIVHGRGHPETRLSPSALDTAIVRTEVFDVAAGPLAVPALLTGMARGLDAHAILAGAHAAVVAAQRQCMAQDRTALLWSLPRASCAPCDRVILSWSDRLARLSAWAADAWARADGSGSTVSSPGDTASGRDPTTLGLAHQTPTPRQVDVLVVRSDPTGQAAQISARELARVAGVARNCGNRVRIIQASDYSAASYGALVARIYLEARFAAAVKI